MSWGQGAIVVVLLYLIFLGQVNSCSSLHTIARIEAAREK